MPSRPQVSEIDDILEQEFSVLDHGFVRVIDYMGNDDAIVQAARVSYGKGTTKVNADKALIFYLMRHSHTTPFEMCEIKLHIKAPIFVARQWMRHRAASINEYSARYSVLDREFYLPDEQHIASQSAQNKQCRSFDQAMSDEEIGEIITTLKDDASHCYDSYQKLLNIDEKGAVLHQNKAGLARELARMNLNLSYYTQWYWKIDLHNLLHFLNLRCHEHAQFEIRVYAEKILEIVAKWVPFAFAAFCEYRKNGVNFSQKGLNIIRQLIAGQQISFEASDMSKREWNEICNALQISNKKV